MREWPPVWLVIGIFMSWTFSTGWGAWAVVLGWVLIAAGCALMLVAVMTMLRAKTTPVPNRTPDALVTTGVFAITRNPIYLGDVLILLGVAFVFGSILGLLFVPVFARIIHHRFIIPEEARLAETFGAAFEAYRDATPRWIALA